MYGQSRGEWCLKMSYFITTFGETWDSLLDGRNQFASVSELSVEKVEHEFRDKLSTRILNFRSF